MERNEDLDVDYGNRVEQHELQDMRERLNRLRETSETSFVEASGVVPGGIETLEGDPVVQQFVRDFIEYNKLENVHIDPKKLMILDGAIHYRTSKGSIRLSSAKTGANFKPIKISSMSSRQGVNNVEVFKNEIKIRATEEEQEVISGEGAILEAQNTLTSLADDLTNTFDEQSRRELRGLATALFSIQEKIKAIKIEIEYVAKDKQKFLSQLKSLQKEGKLRTQEYKDVEKTYTDLVNKESALKESLGALENIELSKTLNDTKSFAEKFAVKFKSIGTRLRELFKEKGLSIATLVFAVSLTLGYIITTIISIVRSFVPSSVTPSPAPTPAPTCTPTLPR